MLTVREGDSKSSGAVSGWYRGPAGREQGLVDDVGVEDVHIAVGVRGVVGLATLAGVEVRVVELDSAPAAQILKQELRDY